MTLILVPNGYSFDKKLLLSLRLKLNTKITLNHPPTTNFFKGSRPSRRLRFDMRAYLKDIEMIPPSQLKTPDLTLFLRKGGTKISFQFSKCSIQVGG